MEIVRRNLTEFIITNSSKENINKKIIEYSIMKLWNLSFIIVTCLIISCFFGMVLELIFFILILRNIRSYAGGIHCKSPISCYIVTCMIIIGTLLFVSYFELSLYINILLYVHGCYMVLKRGIIENINRTVQELEAAYFLMKLKRNIAALSGLVIILIFLEKNQLIMMLMMLIQIVNITQFLGMKHPQGI